MGKIHRSASGVATLMVLLAGEAPADNRVLVIGIDGAGGGYLESTHTPNIDALISAGGVSYQFLNEGALVANPPGPYGASGVNWSTITTGASAAHHGVSDNSFAGNRFDEFPHFFEHLKSHDPTLQTASIVDWAPINSQIVPDQFADIELGGISDDAVRDAAVSLLQSGDPDAIFLHFDQVDHAGHASGWGSVAYRQAIQTVDALIGDVITAMNSRTRVQGGQEDWLVLVTADHGGEGFSHFAGQGPINWEVPFIASGPAVANGQTFAPGTLRDVATTALWHMGVDPFSVPVDGQVVGLPFGAPNGIVGDVNQDGFVSGDGTGPAATDDVTAFVAGWSTTGHASVADAYMHGDLNLDRQTDLADWIILNRLDPALGAAVLQVMSQAAPEPSTWALLLLAAMTASAQLRKRLLRVGKSRACQLTAFLLLAAVVALRAPPAARAALASDLVGLYSFEGDFADTSGSAELSDGVGVGGPQFTPGRVGQALWLPGSGDYVSLPSAEGNELDFGSTSTGDAVDFTMAMWIRQDDFASDPAVLSNKDWSSGGNTGINWAVKGNSVFDLNTKGDAGVRRDLDTAATSQPLTVGAWNLVVMTVDRDGPSRLFINGVNTGTIPVTSAGDFNGSLPWTVGQDGTGAYGVDFNGAVDELAIWRRSLDPVEVDRLWNGGIGIALGEQVLETRLKLVVDRDSGDMRIENNMGVPQELLGYQITSAAGTFDSAAWTPVAGRLDATGDKSLDADDRWIVLSPSGAAGDLSEGSLGEGMLAQEATIELGAGLWQPFYADVDDVTFRYATPDSSVPVAGIVQFTGNGGAAYEPLDLNFDGAIGDGDYAAFLAGYGTSLAGKSAAARHNLGDLNGDGRHTLLDFLQFADEYDQLRGAGAFAALTNVAVPELGASELAIASLLLISVSRREHCWRR